MATWVLRLLLLPPPRPSRGRCPASRLLCFLAVVTSLAGFSSSALNDTLRITSESWVYEVGSSVTINCTVDRALSSEEAIQWSHNGASVSAGQVLRLEDVQFRDNGTYQCILDGAASASHRIDVGLPPEQVTNLRCSSNDFKRIICTWTNGRETNLKTWNQLQQASVYVGGNTTTCNGSVCTVSSESDAAFYRVNSSNALSHTISPNVRFTTDNTVPNPPKLVDLEAISKSSLKVTWRLPSEYDDFPSKDRRSIIYEVFWELLDTSASQMNGSFEIPRSDVKNLEYTILDLPRPHGLYRVSLKVKCYAGWSQSSVPISNRTSEAAPEGGVNLGLHCRADNKAKPGGTRDVHLSWRAFPEEKRNGNLTKYVIDVNGTVHNVSPSVTNYVVQDLDGDKFYQISILARNSAGDSNETACDVDPLELKAIIDITPLVGGIGGVFAVFFLVVFMYCTCARVKNSMIDIPDIKLPHHAQTDSLYTYGNRYHPPHQEAECFDDCMDTSLFVDLTPGTDTSPTCCNSSLTRESILGVLDKHRKHSRFSVKRTNSLDGENHTKQPMEQEALLSPYSETAPNAKSGDYPHHHGNWKDSTLSVRSGGSYLNLRDEPEAGYMNMVARGPNPSSEGDRRGSLDGSVKDQETRMGWATTDSAWDQNPESLTAQDATDLTRVGAAEDRGMPKGSSQEVPPLNGEKGEDWQPLGSEKDNPCDDAYMYMGDGACPGMIETTWTVNHCWDDPKGRQKPHIKQPAIGSLCPPFSADKKLLDPAPSDDGSEIGHYVKQSFSPSPDPECPSSRCESPRPNPRRATKPTDASPSGQPAQRRSQSDIREIVNCDFPGRLSPALKAEKSAGPESVALSDNLGKDALCCVSDEPALDEPSCPASASPGRIAGDIDNDIAPFGEPNPPKFEDGGISGHSSKDPRSGAVRGGGSGSSPAANCDGAYVTISQLPAPPGVRRDDSDYVTQDQLAHLTESPSPTESRWNAGDETGKQEGVAQEEEGTCPASGKGKAVSGESLNDGSRKDLRDSGYVTHDDIARMAVPQRNPADSK